MQSLKSLPAKHQSVLSPPQDHQVSDKKLPKTRSKTGPRIGPSLDRFLSDVGIRFGTPKVLAPHWFELLEGLFFRTSRGRPPRAPLAASQTGPEALLAAFWHPLGAPWGALAASRTVRRRSCLPSGSLLAPLGALLPRGTELSEARENKEKAQQMSWRSWITRKSKYTNDVY